ncbi:hypothetical protein H072_272 [Dactylellina haptotyla CBS 200.50]|uniref:Uncharacterized protein n=1 Tax=Dactylellina haptotyla (strain CBS 200.50) TaxID=1284197 RepID=S8AXX9_DACHA|nr:hypothetical protein H072_272 [Dactylellina haptotyla CBS 200.50]
MIILFLIYVLIFYLAMEGTTAPTYEAQPSALPEIKGIEWTGPVHPGGTNYTFYGTIQQIKLQIENTPGFDPKVYNTAKTSTTTDQDGPLLARAGYYQVECTRSATPAYGSHVFNHIISLSQLRNFHGSCSIQGSNCSKLSCYDSASVALCVSKTTPFYIACSEIVRIGEIMLGTLTDDFNGKIQYCRFLDGTQKTAIYYDGQIKWSPDQWWYIHAYYGACVKQPTLPIPAPGLRICGTEIC